MAADVGGGEGRGHKEGKKGRKKKGNPRIDMTPMVDLGFLLLTFFVLTTTMSSPTTMPVVVPAEEKKEDKKEDQEKVSEKKVLNLLISGKDRVYWYIGIKDVELNLVGYTPDGLRKTISDKGEEIKKSGLFDLAKDPEPMIVLIKMTDDATYKNMVDVLDEMNITNQKKYMLMDITGDEVALIDGYEKSQSMETSVEKSMAKGK